MNKLKFIYDLSIKNKIIIIILSIIFLVHSIGFTFITIWDINRIKTGLETGLALNTKLVANNCVVPLTFGDHQQTTEALSLLKNIEFIETACLFDKHGKLFASYPESLNLNSILTFPEQQDNGFKDGFFYIKEQVFYQNEIYGTLFVKANSKPLTIAKRKIIIALILLSIVLDILAIILAIKMQKYISFPILKLKNHFDEIAEKKDFSTQLAKQNNDEIGSLYDGFNNLLSQIQIRSNERDSNYQKLQTSTEKLNLALGGGEIGIWEWNLKTDVTLWDARMEKMFGLNVGEFKQNYEAFKELIHPDDIAPTEKAIKNALNDIEPYNTVYRIIWENNEIRYIKAKALISKDESGNPLQMTGVCFDITELKKAEEEIKKLNAQLEQKVAERTSQLESKYAELEKMNRIFVGRELKMVELKKEIKELGKLTKRNKKD